MNLTITSGSPLQGEVEVPGDKSISHRAALFAALARGESRVENFLVSGVTQAMLDALTALGIPWELNGSTLTVRGSGLRGICPPKKPLDCGNSATTLRLLTGALAAAGVPATLDGSAGLRRRPMGRIIEPLQKMGVSITSDGGCAPLVLEGSPLHLQPLDYTLPVASAQVKSCLLLAALAADGATMLWEPGPSRDHTERMLRGMGVSVTSEKVVDEGVTLYKTSLTPPQLSLPPISMSIPGDFSSAAFLIVAALITPGSEIQLCDVGLNSARTGLLDALLTMGANIHISAQSTRNSEPVGDLVVKHSHLNATNISGEQVVRMIDEFPIFAIAAAYASGVSTVSDASELRLKESDRIAAMCGELRALGVQALEKSDGFTIEGGENVHGGLVNAHGDHRLAMSLAVAGLAAGSPVIVQDAEMIAESFPAFVSTLQMLGGNLEAEGVPEKVLSV